MNIHFHHHFSRHLFFSVSVHAPTYGLFVRIYLFIFPCCRLMVCPPFTHFAQSVHFIAPSYRLTRSPLRFILVYTPSFVMNTRTHIVCINSFLPCCCPLLLASPSSGTIFAQALYSTDTCEIYLTLAGCEITSMRCLQNREQIENKYKDTR